MHIRTEVQVSSPCIKYFRRSCRDKNNTNKTCHRDRIARLTAPCPSHKKLNVKLFANTAATANPDTDANTDVRGSIIALPGLRPGELKSLTDERTALKSVTDISMYVSTYGQG